MRAKLRGVLAAAVLLPIAVVVPAAPASAAPVRYEAEQATVVQGVVQSDHTGFSGTGFVNYDNVTGSTVQWSITVAAAGSATLALRYANGTTVNRPMDISVNGMVVSAARAFTGTGTWDTWATATLPVTLTAGTNVIRATATTVNGGPNVDFLDVDAATGSPATAMEAESATLQQCVVESNWPGFTGIGFANCDNVVGSGVAWTFPATAGPTNLTFRYANGTTSARPASLTVNGTSAGTVQFPATGSWSTWRTASVSVALAGGENTVRLASTTPGGPPNLDSLTVGGSPGTPGTDWSVAMVESTMARFTPSTLGGWSYPQALYLYGQYLLYQRTGDVRYFNYIKAWADRFIDAAGNISQSFNNLDSMLPGRVLLILFQETGLARYRIAAQKIHDRFATYPRTSDGGFWHATSADRAGQLWADGAFMSMPFLAEYGKIVGDSTYAWDEATKQIVVYAGHLQQPNGLLKHAYDEPRDESWSDDTTGLAPEYWCRAIGWFGMATVQILDAIPVNHPRRAQLITIVQNMVRGFATYQDPASGRWFQVVDKGSRPDDWTETSCSSMYAYTIDKAVQAGYVPASYQVNADRGFQGVLDRISLGSDGRTNLTDVCIGTNVGTYSFYVARERATNDFHGLGAFLIMYEQMRS